MNVSRPASAKSQALSLLVATAILFSIVAIPILAPHWMRAIMVRGTSVVLLMFIIVLVFRYVILLWLGYLHHVESGIRERKDEQSEHMPLVTILVPAYNESVIIERAIRALLRQNYPGYEILVLDDGSTDDTYEKAAAFEGSWGNATVRVVRKSNSGKAASLNMGIALARHPFVMCVDGDSRLSEDSLRHAMPHFKDPDVVAVAGNVKVVNRTRFWSRIQALEYIEGLNMARRAQGFMRAVNIIPGPLGVFRREELLRVGGYEMDTFAEDADLTLKLLAHGWRIVYEDRAIAYTEAPEELLSLIKQRYRWTRGILQALKKRKHVFTHPQNLMTWVSVCMMFFEAIIWPVLNVFGAVFFVIVAMAFGGSTYLMSWWVLLTLLDFAAALHTVVMEGEDLSLLPLALAYRFFFVLLIDIAKLFATAEEFMNVQMTWGKLERLGRI